VTPAINPPGAASLNNSDTARVVNGDGTPGTNAGHSSSSNRRRWKDDGDEMAAHDEQREPRTVSYLVMRNRLVRAEPAVNAQDVSVVPGGSASLDSRLSRGLVAIARIGIAFLWIQNVGWKTPRDDFGRRAGGGLHGFTKDGVDHPVFSPYASFLRHVVLPHFLFFGWLTLLVESAVGALLLVGLATRLFALIGFVQALAITLSVLNTPGEWHWSYYLMMIGQLLLFATCAGRVAGVDGALREVWQASGKPLARLFVLAS
jgi:thiosulfate dehydrogenase (quinone) large subunit